MKNLLLPAAMLAAAVALPAAEFHIDQPAEFARLVPAGAKVAKLAGDMGFIEGPVWVTADGGYLIFSDIPNNELKRWSAAGGLTTFRKPSQNANGNTLDLAGRLLTCEHSGRRVAMLENDGTLRTVVDSFDGKKLNSPNDVVVKSDGTLWFSDPEYGLRTDPATKQRVGKEQAANHVFRHDPKTGKTTAVVKDFVQPNGLAFSPDEKKLYVADSGTPRHIRVFDVAADGSLRNGAVFCAIDKGAPDGIRVDKDGRVWSSAGDGVQIFSTKGERIGKILTPEAPANLCFGGTDGKTLYITARKSLYAIQVAVAGASR
ncbi:MAG: SMP-30/gluconolactonase/LRE family protein [Opitutaceae bacterium]|nr:SMP-30/gluconolactonase/LRE family protein [Opitutaceae bacterium]